MDSFIVISLIKTAVVFAVLMTTLAYLQWVERKVIAHIQVRPGPYRVGPHGLLQPLADVIKLITKEDLLPPYVNKPLYLAAPFLAITMALLSISVIPFGPTIEVAGYQTWMQLTDLNIGVLFILAVSSMGVYGIALAGWASNNKYALLGGLRSSAQMISYELPMSLSIVAPLLLSNTLSLRELVGTQLGGFWHWNLFRGPFPQVVSFCIFLIAAFAETNRVPFDLPEAESELVAGFHTEYASMKFAMFFIGEYTSMIAVSSLFTILFFGGWLSPFPASWTITHYLPSVIFIPLGLWVFYDGIRYETMFGRLILPGLGAVFTVLGFALFLFSPVNEAIQGPFWFFAKVGAVLFFYIWMRGTLPRFRYDQLMDFGWKFLLPVSIANVVLTSAVIMWRMK